MYCCGAAAQPARSTRLRLWDRLAGKQGKGGVREGEGRGKEDGGAAAARRGGFGARRRTCGDGWALKGSGAASRHLKNTGACTGGGRQAAAERRPAERRRVRRPGNAQAGRLWRKGSGLARQQYRRHAESEIAAARAPLRRATSSRLAPAGAPGPGRVPAPDRGGRGRARAGRLAGPGAHRRGAPGPKSGYSGTARGRACSWSTLG